MNYRTFVILFLGILFAFGPFLTDMYLPAFPQLQVSLNTTPSMVQMTLSTCMIGLAIGQALWGPLSDKYGRKPITNISLLIFMTSSIGCIFAPSIEFLMVMRLLQGVGGSGGLVISRSIAADMYSGKDLAKILALVGAVNGIAPVTAPVAGGLLTDSIGWSGIFVVLFALGFVLLLANMYFRESLPIEKRMKKSVMESFATYATLIKNKRYVWSILQYGFLHGIFFSYLASSPFILQTHYGFSATAYSIFFAVNATTVGIASMLSMRFRTPSKCTFVASSLLMLVSALVTGVLTRGGNIWLYEGCMLVQVFCCGLCFASTPAMAMDLERKNAGAAAALLGICTYLFGCIVTPLIGIGNILNSTAMIYCISSIFTLHFAYKLWKEDKE